MSIVEPGRSYTFKPRPQNISYRIYAHRHFPPLVYPVPDTLRDSEYSVRTEDRGRSGSSRSI
jgi:hypothetical protein